MNLPDDADFTISFDGKDHEGEYAGEILEKKVDSLGWKVTFMSIIIPCLIAVVGVLSYFSITKKVDDFQHTGSATVAEFSQGYDDRLREMQDLLTAQKNAVDKELARIGQNASAVDAAVRSIKDIQADLTKNRNGIRANQKSVQSRAADAKKMSAAVAGLKKDMEKLSSAVGESSRRMLALGRQLETVETRLAGLKDMTALKPDTETVRAMLTQFQKNLMPSVEVTTETLKNDLKKLAQRLSNLERQVTVSAQGRQPLPPGKIVEEDLK